MAFMYLFDLVDFDEKGEVCKSGKFDENKTKANYLYLVSKYNQKILDMQGLKVPEFFKTELATLLTEVENGADFAAAKRKVLANCSPKVKMLERESDSDKEFVSLLNQNISVGDKNFASKMAASTSTKQTEYIITKASGDVFGRIISGLQADMSDKSTRSKIYKDVIEYNGFMATLEKVGAKDAGLETAKLYA